MVQALTRIQGKGSAREIGRCLGLAGRDATRSLLVPHPLWAKVNSAGHLAAVSRMAEATRARFPLIWQEIEGLAEGLDLPVMQVFAWNCRGDLLASAPDGCTTVAEAGQTPMLAHNEDGFPFLRGKCFLAELEPENQPALLTFAYPASIPGHTFAANAAGLVQTVNNIRLTGVFPQIPRMVLGRAVLAQKTVEDAISLLREGPASGGFHFYLAQAGERAIHSVEFGAGRASVALVTGRQAHANHALHLPQNVAQIITQSSADRQHRAGALVAADIGALEILRDTAEGKLPIWRNAADDPDDENTIASFIAQINESAVDWQVVDGASRAVLYQGTLTVRP